MCARVYERENERDREREIHTLQAAASCTEWLPSNEKAQPF